MVVDDSEVAMEIITDDLTEAGFTVLPATSGQEAYEIISTGYKPELILLDVMLPGMNGYEFCKLVKSKPETKDIPILFVSTKDESELQEMIVKAGANGYLRKAVLTMGGLSKLIEKYLK
jgi:CheY-like chemotaxis protein